MVAWVNGTGSGRLQLIDVEHDTVNNQQNTVHVYSINGYTGTFPVTIQDFPGQQQAYVFADGGGPAGPSSLQPVNTATDTASQPLAGIAPGTTSAYITDDFRYLYSVSPTVTHNSAGYLTVLRAADGTAAQIPLPGATKLAPSPGAVSGSSSLLIFAANANPDSNNVYQLVGVGQNSEYDCTQQLIPVDTAGNAIAFDKPINAVYSSDGTSAFVLDCGPECGGTTSGISVLNIAQLAAGAAAAYQPRTGCNIDPAYTPGPFNVTVQNIAVPGGVTAALQLGNTLFLVGQMMQSNGELGGMVTALNLLTLTQQSFRIGDGNHFRMRLGDNNTLWIAARNCSDGYQAATGGSTGCITMVPYTQDASGSTYTVNGSGIVIEPGQGSAAGLAPITGYNKIYTVEGPAVYIYSTVDGTPISNVNVQVAGTPQDIAFIDGDTITAP